MGDGNDGHHEVPVQRAHCHSSRDRFMADFYDTQFVFFRIVQIFPYNISSTFARDLSPNFMKANAPIQNYNCPSLARQALRIWFKTNVGVASVHAHLISSRASRHVLPIIRRKLITSLCWTYAIDGDSSIEYTQNVKSARHLFLHNLAWHNTLTRNISMSKFIKIHADNSWTFVRSVHVRWAPLSIVDCEANHMPPNIPT